MNQEQFEYDVHSLVKAFYPLEEVKIKKEGELPFLDIKYKESSISFTMKNQKSEIERNMEDRIDTKNKLKREIYELLSLETKKKLPWGTLTGIRPVKLAMKLLEAGKKEREVKEYLKETYLLSNEKLELSLEIAKREKQIVKQFHIRDGYSLYIGIPFCPTTCLYCSFPSFPIHQWKGRVNDYLDALEKEIKGTWDILKEKKLDTIYIGGGTPTSLTPEELSCLLSMIEKYFPIKEALEFTVEAGRPDTMTREKLSALRKYGIERISINPQTMEERTLELIGRSHSKEQVKEAFYLARELGFSNINMDLILGLPGEGKGEIRRTIEEVKKMDPDSLTVHSLAVKRASKLGQWMEEHPEQLLLNNEEIMNIPYEGARQMGLLPYYLYRQKNMAGNFENVGYAKPGKYGMYNIITMEEKQSILALGAGSISKRVHADGRIERCENVKDVALYIEKIDEMIERKRKLLRDF